MSEQRVRVKRRKICAGDLRDRITLHTFPIQPPAFGQVDLTKKDERVACVWSAIETINGTDRFDETNVNILLTHRIYIRHRDDVTAETWIELADNRLLNVVDSEDLDERKLWIKMVCTERGDKNRAVNEA